MSSHTVAQKIIPVFCELFSLAIIFKLSRQNGFDVLRFCGHDEAIDDPKLDRVAPGRALLVKHVGPHLIDFVIQRTLDSFPNYVNMPGEVALSNGRAGAHFIDFRIDVELAGDGVTDIEGSQGTDELGH